MWEKTAVDKTSRHNQLLCLTLLDYVFNPMSYCVLSCTTSYYVWLCLYIILRGRWSLAYKYEKVSDFTGGRSLPRCFQESSCSLGFPQDRHHCRDESIVKLACSVTYFLKCGYVDAITITHYILYHCTTDISRVNWNNMNKLTESSEAE